MQALRTSRFAPKRPILQALLVLALLAGGLVAVPGLVAEPAGAQSAPTCASTASDSDGDGWGWENNQSCVVSSAGSSAPSNTCDYSDSGANGGWGYDPVNGVSCPPNGTLPAPITAADVAPAPATTPLPPSTPAPAPTVAPDATVALPHVIADIIEAAGNAPCVDSDGDGWGWNGIESCRPEPVGDYSEIGTLAGVRADGHVSDYGLVDGDATTLVWRDPVEPGTVYQVFRDGWWLGIRTDVSYWIDETADPGRTYTYSVEILNGAKGVITLGPDSEKIVRDPSVSEGERERGSNDVLVSKSFTPECGGVCRHTQLENIDNGITTGVSPSSRLGAYAATAGYPAGSVGYAAHQGIGAIYMALGEFGQEDIGNLFNSQQALNLYNQPVTSAANRELAELEFEYWDSQPWYSAGGWLGRVFSATARAHIQLFLGGQPDPEDFPNSAGGGSDGFGTGSVLAGSNGDSDGDGISDWLDDDDDIDGISDLIDRDPLGGAQDTDGDGIGDSVDFDIDGDGAPNNIDNDADGDGVRFENDLNDRNPNVGAPPTTTTTDNDECSSNCGGGGADDQPLPGQDTDGQRECEKGANDC